MAFCKWLSEISKSFYLNISFKIEWLPQSQRDLSWTLSESSLYQGTRLRDLRNPGFHLSMAYRLLNKRFCFHVWHSYDWWSFYRKVQPLRSSVDLFLWCKTYLLLKDYGATSFFTSEKLFSYDQVCRISLYWYQTQ